MAKYALRLGGGNVSMLQAALCVCRHEVELVAKTGRRTEAKVVAAALVAATLVMLAEAGRMVRAGCAYVSCLWWSSCVMGRWDDRIVRL